MSFKNVLNALLEQGMYEELEELIGESKEFIKYNKLCLFNPYPYQKRFMKAGASFKQRMMRSGNQTGKSYGASFEVAMHLTGLYQDYYEGERLEGSNKLFWCVGIDLDSTARVMQKALFGTANAKIEDELGTGSIPKDCIDFDTMTKDGGRILSARIKHVDGGYNTVQFFGAAQGAERLMGAVVHFIWLDR